MRREMTVSALWLQFAVLTFLAGFTVLGILAYKVGAERPPLPERVVDPAGRVLFTRADNLAGQHVFQKYGLMEYGTIFGHGAYLGPDFTAQYLHEQALLMADSYAPGDPATIAARVASELKANRYDPATGTLVFSAGEAAAYEHMVGFYRDWFGRPEVQSGVEHLYLRDPGELRALTSYFAWASWVTTAPRPGKPYSYTNNWPAETLVGNTPTADAVLWSVLSLIALLGGIGIVFYAFGRYDLLGWHRAAEEGAGTLRFRQPEEVRLTPSQRAIPWYFLVVAGLFLAQGLLGGLNAHYHADPRSFFGLHIGRWLPYNLSRTWHLQLALFFVSASFLAMGIFITPLIARREPRYQGVLAKLLFGALVLVVLGSLAGEALSIMGVIPLSWPWFWVGDQGWEYLDLGRLWQILLVVGLALWVIILIRGLRPRLREEHPGNLPYLFLYSALSIPLFYAAGLVFGPNSEYAITDFWRFWVVHLWVEDFLELFTTIVVAFVFVLLGVVSLRVATRVVYLDIILYSIGGVIGTMHHLYFSGTPAFFMALGAFFSAMEVVPLVLLTFEAWRFMQIGSARGDSTFRTDSEAFPHKWAVMFLIAVGFWNFLGAGVFGFLINLPIVSYWEIGTAFTPNHGHGALMGVYGMLAVGFFMFVARYFLPRDRASDEAMKISFWSLNVGLGWMIFTNLVPVGILQLYDSVKYGYWHARAVPFFQQGVVHALEWVRFPGDVLFIVGGIGPIVYLAIRMFLARDRPGELPTEAGTEALTRG